MKVGSLEIDFLVNLAKLKQQMDSAVSTVGSATTAVGRAVDGAVAKFKAWGSGLLGMSENSRRASNDLKMLSYQANDVITMWSMGAPPMQIFVSQMGQIVQVVQNAEGGLKTLALGVGKMVLAWSPLLAILAVVGVGFKRWTDQVNDSAGLDAYAKKLGLTTEELKKAGGATVTMGDMIGGMWKTLSDKISGGIGGKRIIDYLFGPNDLPQIGKFLAQIYAVFVGAYRAIVATWRMIPQALGDFVVQLDNKIVEGVVWMINAVIGKINAFTQAANKLLGKDLFGQIGAVSFKPMVSSAAGAAKQVGDIWASSYQGAYNEAWNAEKDFFAKSAANAQQIARARLDAAAADAKKSKTTKDKPSIADAIEKGRLDALFEQAKQLAAFIEKIGKPLDNDMSTTIAGLDAFVAQNNDIEDLVQAQNSALRDQADLWEAIAQNVDAAGNGMADAFGKAGQALGQLASTYANYREHQASEEAAHQRAIEQAGTNQILVERENQLYATRTATAQIGLYGDMATAAKGFFKQGSDGYKAMQKAEQVFRAVEFAMSVKSMIQSAVETGTKIAGHMAGAAAAGTEAVANAAATTPFPASLGAMAAIAAALASIGVLVGGSFGGGGGSAPTSNQGTGTVLGDESAKSDSIKNAIELLGDVDRLTMGYSAQMAQSLKSIESQIGNLSSLIVRIGGTDGINASSGVATGFKADATGTLLGAVPLIGGVLKSLFGTKTSVIASGIYGGAQSLDSILSNGFDAGSYSDVQKKKKLFGLTTSTKYSTQYGETDPQVGQQFTLILKSFNDAIMAAATPLGTATDEISQRLSTFVVSIGKIDLQGLTGEEIQDKLNAVFGAAADNMAQAAVPGLEKFQQVGEGYFETLTRVATTVEAVSSDLNMLGISTQNLGLDAKMGIAGLFDSVDAMNQATQTYFETFYTDAEQSAMKAKQLGDVFTSLGLAMPDTIAGYRALVDAQDLTTAAGQNTYATLLQLAPAFAEIATSAQTATSAAAILRERTSLEQQLLQLEGDTVAIRKAELDALDPSNRAIKELIYSLQDQATATQAATAAAEAAAQAQAAITNEQAGLNQQLLEAQGNTAAIRASTLAKLLSDDARNTQQQIWNIQDAAAAKTAADAAAAAAEQAAQQAAEEAAQASADAAKAAQELRDAWTSIADSILDEVKRIRGLTSDPTQGYAALLAQFNDATAATRGGDQDAGKNLPALSQALLDAAAASATSQQELDRIQALVASSLDQTYQLITGMSASDMLGSAEDDTTSQSWWEDFASGQTAAASSPTAANDTADLRTEVANLRSDMRTAMSQLAGYAKRTSDILTNVTSATGGDRLATKEVA